MSIIPPCLLNVSPQILNFTPSTLFCMFQSHFSSGRVQIESKLDSPAFPYSICVSPLVQSGRSVVDVDRLRAFPGAHPRLRGDGRTAELLGPGLHGQDSQLGCVWISGTRFRPSRHAVPTAEQNQRHFRMLRVKRKGMLFLQKINPRTQ